MEYKSTSHNTFEVTGSDSDLAQIAPAIKAVTRGVLSTAPGKLFGKGNKSERQAIRNIVESASAPTQQKNSNPQRYITLTSVAQANGLNHGKSWVCDWRNVDANSLDPAWEGELICYVYPD